MLLRSSSTPVLGSLLSSFSESPTTNNGNHHHHHSDFHNTTPNNTKLSCIGGGGSHNLTKSILRSSPSVDGFRRVQSDGNLEELANGSYGLDEFTISSKKFARKKAPHCSTLEAIPSFSVNSLGARYDDSDDDDDDEEDEDERFDFDEKSGESGGFMSFRVDNLVSDQIRAGESGYGGGKMYLAAGLGLNVVDGGGYGGGGGGGGYRPVAFDRDGGDSHRGVGGMEEHYRSMLEGNPGNSLVLRNYAQFLYQKKGDLEGAEEYYSRAILADPEDGEVLSQYAKLIWELHHDQDRALSYFERAVQASSEDSHVHAAYASFLWEVEDEEEDEDENGAETSRLGPPLVHHGFMASATAAA